MNNNFTIAIRCQYQSWRHLYLAVRDLGRNYPWCCIFAIILTATAISFAEVGSARAERDNISQQLYRTQQYLQQQGINIKNISQQ